MQPSIEKAIPTVLPTIFPSELPIDTPPVLLQLAELSSHDNQHKNLQAKLDVVEKGKASSSGANPSSLYLWGKPQQP